MQPALLAEIRGQLVIRSHGVRSAQVRKLAAAVYRKIKDWPLAERNGVCLQLWKSGADEEGRLAIYLYRHFRKQCALCEFHLFEKWIERYVTNWGQCDGIANYLIAASIENEPTLAELLPAWTSSPNRWKRRASAVSLVHEARKGRATALILKIAAQLLEDQDALVRKGVGWLLKEAYAAKPREVVKFLERRSGQAPRLVLRIAAEKMTPAHRNAMFPSKAAGNPRADRGSAAR